MTKFLNTRILLSGATILAAAVVIIGATLAFFSDVETSEANAFTAGDVEVAIGDLEHTYGGNIGNAPIYDDDGFSFDLTDIKPLDRGQVSYVLNNNSNDAHICAMVEEVGNAENIRNGSEQEAGDTTTGNPGNGNGELQNFMSFSFGGSTGLLSEIEGEWFNVGTVLSPGNASFAIGYCFGEYDGTNCEANTNGDVNQAQTDSMTADISFYAVQTRNNEAPFDCASLNEGEPGEEDEVGAVLSAYVEPAETCTATVAAGDSIQAAIDSATAGDVICLEDGIHNGDTYPLSLNKDNLTLAGVNGPLASAELEGGVMIDNDGVTVTGLIINDSTALSETFGVYVNSGVDDAEVSYSIIQGPGSTGRGVINATGTTTNLLVDNNQISGWLTGVFLNPSTGMEVSYNTISGNGVGSGNDNPINNNIHHNVIKDNTIEGVGALVNVGESLAVNFNNIYSNGAGNDLNSYGTETVNAENNWWGDTDPSDNVSGPVDYDPSAPSAYAEN